MGPHCPKTGFSVFRGWFEIQLSSMIEGFRGHESIDDACWGNLESGWVFGQVVVRQRGPPEVMRSPDSCGGAFYSSNLANLPFIARRSYHSLNIRILDALFI
jgi:hypothetical protein